MGGRKDKLTDRDPKTFNTGRWDPLKGDQDITHRLAAPFSACLFQAANAKTRVIPCVIPTRRIP